MPESRYWSAYKLSRTGFFKGHIICSLGKVIGSIFFTYRCNIQIDITHRVQMPGLLKLTAIIAEGYIGLVVGKCDITQDIVIMSTTEHGIANKDIRHVVEIAVFDGGAYAPGHDDAGAKT